MSFDATYMAFLEDYAIESEEKEVIEEIPEPEPVKQLNEYVQELNATETQNRSREVEFDYTAQRDRMADHAQYTKQTQYIMREKFEKEDLLREEEESAADDFNADSSLYNIVKDGSIVAKRWF